MESETQRTGPYGEALDQRDRAERALLSIYEASEQPGDAGLFNVVRHAANDEEIGKAALLRRHPTTEVES